MKKTLSLILFTLLGATAYAWGPLGHGTVAAVADNAISNSTRKQVEHYLGRSMPFYGVWADEFRSDPRYAYTSNHIVAMSPEFKYIPSTKKQDCIQTINEAIRIIADRKNQTDSTVAVHLKLLIHMVGDIHCPGHMKMEGRNWGFKVFSYKGSPEKQSYHAIWDEEIIARRREGLSPKELGEDFSRLSKKEVKLIQEGTPVDWAEQTARETSYVFDLAHEGDELFKEFYNPMWEVAQRQLTLGGYRLAKILEDLF